MNHDSIMLCLNEKIVQIQRKHNFITQFGDEKENTTECCFCCVLCFSPHIGNQTTNSLCFRQKAFLKYY